MKTPVGVAAPEGETPSLTGEVVEETNRSLEHAQAHPLGNESAPEGPNWIVGNFSHSDPTLLQKSVLVPMAAVTNRHGQWRLTNFWGLI